MQYKNLLEEKISNLIVPYPIFIYTWNTTSLCEWEIIGTHKFVEQKLGLYTNGCWIGCILCQVWFSSAIRM